MISAWQTESKIWIHILTVTSPPHRTMGQHRRRHQKIRVARVIRSLRRTAAQPSVHRERLFGTLLLAVDIDYRSACFSGFFPEFSEKQPAQNSGKRCESRKQPVSLSTCIRRAESTP